MYSTVQKQRKSEIGAGPSFDVSCLGFLDTRKSLHSPNQLLLHLVPLDPSLLAEQLVRERREYVSGERAEMLLYQQLQFTSMPSEGRRPWYARSGSDSVLYVM